MTGKGSGFVKGRTFSNRIQVSPECCVVWGLLLVLALECLRLQVGTDLSNAFNVLAVPAGAVKYSRLFFWSNLTLQHAAVLGIPVLFVLAYSGGKVRLRFIFLLTVFYVLVILSFGRPLWYGLRWMKSGEPFFHTVKGQTALLLDYAQRAFRSPLVYVEAVLNLAAGLVIARLARRKNRKFAAGRRRALLVLAAVLAVLAVVTVLSLKGFFHGFMTRADAAIESWGLGIKEQEVWLGMVQYLTFGGSLLSWLRIGVRLPVLIFGWIVGILAIYYCVGRIGGKRILQVSGAAVLAVALPLCLTPAAEGFVQTYYENLWQWVLIPPRSHWFYHTPPAVMYTLQLAVLAALLLGAARLFRYLGGDASEN